MSPIAIQDVQDGMASVNLKGRAKYSSQDIMDLEHEYSAYVPSAQHHMAWG